MQSNKFSVGSVTYEKGEISSRQSPSWLVCEHPDRTLDYLASWHHDGCEKCIELARSLAFEYPDDPVVKWLLDHLELV